MKLKVLLPLALCFGVPAEAEDNPEETWFIADVVAPHEPTATTLCNNRCFILVIGQSPQGDRPIVTYPKSKLKEILNIFHVSNLSELRNVWFSPEYAEEFPILRKLVETAKRECNVAGRFLC